MSPNSVFIPISHIREVQFRKGIPVLRAHHLVLSTLNTPLIIFQDPATENMFQTFIGQFTRIWQSEFVRAIQQICLRNASG